jgi:hypothetical protein
MEQQPGHWLEQIDIPAAGVFAEVFDQRAERAGGLPAIRGSNDTTPFSYACSDPRGMMPGP